MSPEDVYKMIVRKLGVPARTYHDANGEMHMEGPFTPLSDEALERLGIPTPREKGQ